MEKMQKIASKDVTETLARAMEHADRMKHVLIIYETKEGEETSFGFFQNDELDVKTANYMNDVFKAWVLDGFHNTGE
jgi:S-adenosylmethionine synthetase